MGKPRSRDLVTLGRDLQRCRVHAARLWRNYQAIDERHDPHASTDAHQAWSEAVDEALGVADAISRDQAATLADLVTQFEAIWWWIVEDDCILDVSARQWLLRFCRSLRGLATKNTR